MVTPASVDEYLAAIPEAPRAALEKLRATIKGCRARGDRDDQLPDAAFKLNGRVLVSYAAFKNHCSLFPASEKVLELHGEALKPYYAGKGTIRFTVDEPIPAALVRKIVKTRVKEH